MGIKGKFSNWNKTFQMKKMSKNKPFCYYDLAGKFLPKNKKARIIDVGCGSCRFEEYLKLSERYENLVLLDGNEHRVHILRERFNHVIPYKAPDRLPFDDESVDYIFSAHLIEHLHYEELYELLKEFDRVLKSNGILVISSPTLWRGFYNNLDHVKPYHPMIFETYLCDLDSEDHSYNRISSNYKREELVYRYHTFVDIDNRVGSSIKPIDFLIQGLRFITRALGLKRYTQTGYTTILRKQELEVKLEKRGYVESEGIKVL